MREQSPLIDHASIDVDDRLADEPPLQLLAVGRPPSQVVGAVEQFGDRNECQDRWVAGK